MKKVLKEYYKIFLSCTVGHMMSAAQKRMEENLKLWKAMDFHEELTLDEINEFIEGSPEVPCRHSLWTNSSVPLWKSVMRWKEKKPSCS